MGSVRKDDAKRKGESEGDCDGEEVERRMMMVMREERKKDKV